MSHKYFFILLAILLLEAAALWALFSAFTPYAAAMAPVNPVQHKPFPENLPREMILQASGQSLTIADPGEQSLGQGLLDLLARIYRPPRDAQFVMEDGKVTTFLPDLPGRDLDLYSARTQIVNLLAANQEKTITIKLAAEEEVPARTLAETNSLGIREMLAGGVTDFTGSSSARITNIRAGASRYNGVLIAPGEEFTFNRHLGPIDAAHGFLPELVIKPEGTVPEFGGGLCQVSTTAFRAAFFAGLPITQRRNHAYAVKYYEWIADDLPRAPGLDATIYPGATDLKFINDTPASILIATRIEGKRLYFDFYGTPDGRQVTMDGPHPFDRKPSGAVKSSVTRTVTKNGEAATVTFNSNYVSPDKYPRVTEYPKPVESVLIPDNPNPNPPDT